MAALNIPQGNIVAISGKFTNGVAHDDLRSALNGVGAAAPKDLKQAAWTVLVATLKEYAKPSALVQEARENGRPILKEVWAEECLKRGSWIPPEEHHYLERGSPGVAAQASAQASHISPEQSRENSPEQHPPSAKPAPTALSASPALLAETPPPATPPAIHPVTPAETPAETPPAAPPGVAQTAPLAALAATPAVPSVIPAAPPTENPPATDPTTEQQQQDEQHLISARDRWYAKTKADHIFVIPVHPADKHKPKEQQRTNYTMHIDFSLRHFIWVSDPNSEFPVHRLQEKSKKNLRASWLLLRKEAGLRGQEYIDDCGHVLTSTSENVLGNHKMENFDWWGSATYNGNPCYNAGVLPGEDKPRVWARTTQKKKWADIDIEIDRIRRVFDQPSLKQEKELSRNEREKSVILENLRESEKYLEAERDALEV